MHFEDMIRKSKLRSCANSMFLAAKSLNILICSFNFFASVINFEVHQEFLKVSFTVTYTSNNFGTTQLI